MTLNDTWIILTACLVALCCVIPGCFLVLRKMGMFGDAISHAVLPGLVIAYLVTGSRSGSILLIGAAAVGLLVTFLIETLQKKMRIQSDAAIGVTYTFLFAVGVILISAFAGQIDLDQDCVLYGEIALVPFDLVSIFGIQDIPRQVWIAGTLLIIMLFLLIAGYRGLYLTTFDAGYATAIGISVAFWHYMLMGMVSLATVVSFESVGAIMVIGLLVGPAATAALFAKRLPVMLILAGLLGIIACISGYFLAVWWNASVAGAIAVMIGVIFAFSLGLRTLIPSLNKR